MSFDVFFQTCNLSEESEEVVNPFTGETMQNPVGETASDSEREAIARLLADCGAATSDEHGCYVVELSDGSSVELFFSGLSEDPEFSGGTAALRGLTPVLSAFLYDLASRGNLAMLPATEDGATIVVSDDAAKSVASRWPDAIVIENTDALHALLSNGVDLGLQIGAPQDGLDRPGV